jgi:hypothetical protein
MAIYRLVNGEIVDVDYTADDERLVLGEIVIGQEAAPSVPIVIEVPVGPVW